jgi:uncharacterized protein (DUF58 family)
MAHPTRLTREGVYYLFMLLFVIGGAVFREVNLLLVIAAIMIGPIVFSWRIVTATLSNLRATRRVAPSVAAGMPLGVELLVENRNRRLASWALEIRDRVEMQNPFSASECRVSRVLIPSVPAGATARASYVIRPTRRGRIRLTASGISTRFPWGFVAGECAINLVHEVLVTPRLGRLTSQWSQLIGARESAGQQSERTRVTAQRRGFSEGDYYGLREWRPGDSRRWIHWRTSAKIGGMAVLQFEQRRNQDLILIVDLWNPVTAEEQHKLAVEWTVSFAGTIVADICHRSAGNLTLAVVGQETRSWDRAASPLLAREVLEYLAEVRPGTSVESAKLDWDSIRGASSGTKVVVASTRAPAVELFAAAESSDVEWIEAGSLRFQQLFSGES